MNGRSIAPKRHQSGGDPSGWLVAIREGRRTGDRGRAYDDDCPHCSDPGSGIVRLKREAHRRTPMLDPDLVELRQQAERGDQDAVDQLVDLDCERGDRAELQRLATNGY